MVQHCRALKSEGRVAASNSISKQCKFNCMHFPLKPFDSSCIGMFFVITEILTQVI